MCPRAVPVEMVLSSLDGSDIDYAANYNRVMRHSKACGRATHRMLSIPALVAALLICDTHASCYWTHDNH